MTDTSWTENTHLDCRRFHALYRTAVIEEIIEVLDGVEQALGSTRGARGGVRFGVGMAEG